MRFSEDQMHRQKGYTMTIVVLDRMQRNGILTQKEFMNSEAIAVMKYKPIILDCFGN